MDDWTCLKQYTETRNEEAFAALLKRHLPLVYATALRICQEPNAAEDVAQLVFILLGRKASSLKPSGALASWLYQTTVFKARKYREKEERRHRLEQKLEHGLDQDRSAPSTELDWLEIRPLLDSACESLKTEEKDVLILRFLEQLPFKKVGEILEISEDAARKRSSRAILKLSEWFGGREIYCTEDALNKTISASAIVAVSPQLFDRTVNAVMAQSSAVGVAAKGAFWGSKGAMVGCMLAGASLPILSDLWNQLDSAPLVQEGGRSSAEEDKEQFQNKELSDLEREWWVLWNTHGPPEHGLDELLTTIKSIESPVKRGAFHAMACREWISNGLPLENVNHETQQAIFEILLQSDVQRAERYASSFDEVVLYRFLPSLVSLGRSHPEGLATFIKLLRPPTIRFREYRVHSRGAKEGNVAVPLGRKFDPKEEIQEAVLSLAERDLDSAERVIQELSGWHKLQALVALVRAKAEGDLDQALNLIHEMNLSSRGEKNLLIRELFMAWINIDSAAVFEILESDESPVGFSRKRNEFREHILTAYAREDWAGALRLLGSGFIDLFRISGPMSPFSAFVSERIREDLEGTLSGFQINEIPDIERMDALRRLSKNSELRARTWQWLKNQRQTSFQLKLAERLYKEAQDSDPTFAQLMLQEGPNLLKGPLNEKRPGLTVGGKHYSISDLLANRGKTIVGENGGYELTIAAGADIRPRREPSELDDKIDQQSATSENLIELFARSSSADQADAVFGMGGSLAKRDPAKAISWAMSLSDERWRDDALFSIVQTWSKFDLFHASKWVDSFEPGERRDLAADSLAHSWCFQNDYEAGWSWAMSIRDSTTRIEVLARVVEVARDDGFMELSDTLISNSDLSIFEKKQINELSPK